MIKIKYQPELDGLRAIAITGVIFYHAELAFFGIDFSGGYIGVDVFVVLSGYLISKLLTTEFINTGRICLIDFLFRRAKRILPSLFVLVIAMFFVSYFYLLPASLIDFSKSSISNIFLISNYFFHYSGLEYQAEDAITKPLLHTWSLSLEAQFYIIFSLVFAFIIKNSKNLKYYLILFIILNIIYCEYLLNLNSSANFYFLSSRIWEFLFGFLAYLFEKNFSRTNDLIKNFFQLVGIIIIFLSFIFFDHNTKHPSTITLIPIFGCLLVILFSNNNFVSKLLSLKIVTFTGIISYSLYLWHFPLMAYYRITLDNTGSILEKLFLVFLIICGSLLNYFLIEKQFRRKNLTKKNILYFLILLATIISLLNLITLKKDGFKSKYIVDNINIGYQKQILKPVQKLDPNSSKNNILIIGNSHGRDFFNLLTGSKDYEKSFNFSYFFNQISCMNTSLKKIDNLECHNFSELDAHNFKYADTILFSTRWTNKDINNLEKIIPGILNKQKKIYIISNQFNSNFYKENIFTRYRQNFTIIDEFLFENKKIPNSEELIAIEKNYFKSYYFNKSNELKNNRLIKIADKFNIYYFDRNTLTCDPIIKRCKVLTPNNKKIFSDPDHYNEDGFNYLAKKLFSMGFLSNL